MQQEPVEAAGRDGQAYVPYTDLPTNMQGPYTTTRPGKIKQALITWVFGKGIPFFFSLLRTFAPVIRFPFTNTIIVTRFDDVQEIFCRKEDFFVPYIKTAGDLKWDPAFLLALKHDDEHYRDMLKKVWALWDDRDLDFITDIANRVSRKALESHDGEIDAVQDLMVPVVLHVIQDYYGIPVPGLDVREAIANGERSANSVTPEEHEQLEKLDAFILGSVAMAGYLFGPQSHSDKAKQKIHWACNWVWPVIYDAVNNYDVDPGPQTIIGRARALRESGELNVSDKELRSYLLGMIVGFLPTNTNANGRSFDVLMKRPQARAAAQAAVDAGDDDALLGIIYEALRLQYILPGVWREMESQQYLRIGTTKPKKLDQKRLIYISGMAAMMDRRRIPGPKDFVADRSRDVYLIYGHRFHYCVGAHLSDKMMLAMFRQLFSHHAEYKKGHKLVFNSNMPWNLVVTYDKES
jgi:cytochrome P450